MEVYFYKPRSHSFEEILMLEEFRCVEISFFVSKCNLELMKSTKISRGFQGLNATCPFRGGGLKYHL